MGYDSGSISGFDLGSADDFREIAQRLKENALAARNVVEAMIPRMRRRLSSALLSEGFTPAEANRQVDHALNKLSEYMDRQGGVARSAEQFARDFERAFVEPILERRGTTRNVNGGVKVN